MKLRNIFATSFLFVISFFSRIFASKAIGQEVFNIPEAGVYTSPKDRIMEIATGIFGFLIGLFFIFFVIKLFEIIIKKIKGGKKGKAKKK